MLDWPSRLLLAVTSGVVAFTITGALLGSPDGPVTEVTMMEGPGGMTIPAFALAPARPAVEDAVDQPDPDAPAPSLTVAFAGDVHGEPPISQVLDAGNNPLEGLADVLGSADLAVVNLETAVGDTGTPADKTYTFQADPALVTSLAESGVDVVTLANNHALDFGIEAAAETRRHAEDAGLEVVGHGEDRDEAYAPHVVDVEGRTVAVVGLSRVLPVIEWGAGDTRPGLASAYDEAAAVEAVRRATTMADHVVVTIHWGRERWVCPDEAQLSLARALAAAGADVIAGHHPHVLQGITTVGDALVAYSLGNFVFYARTPATRQSGVLTVTLGEEGVEDHTWHPAEIDDQGRPQPVATQAPIPTGEQIERNATGPECGPPG